LGWYVYRLIDPRNGETFYVGKGRGNRVFVHVHAADGLEGDDLENKVKRIRQIQNAGLEVAHVIHRHGLDERSAFEVEAALIDAYPGLTNVAGGSGATTSARCTPRKSSRATPPNPRSSRTRYFSSA
jgi:uncharacterized protein